MRTAEQSRRDWIGGVLAAGVLASLPVGAAEARSGNREIAERILTDAELKEVLQRARALLRTGLNAGDGYGDGSAGVLGWAIVRLQEWARRETSG